MDTATVESGNSWSYGASKPWAISNAMGEWKVLSRSLGYGPRVAGVVCAMERS